MLSRFRQFLIKTMSSDLPVISENVITINAKKSIDNVDVDELNVDSQAKRSKIESIATLENKSDENKIKKRKYALLIGYCGEGYFGLQR